MKPKTEAASTALFRPFFAVAVTCRHLQRARSGRKKPAGHVSTV
jgi:hypothetical protein